MRSFFEFAGYFAFPCAFATYAAHLNLDWLGMISFLVCGLCVANFFETLLSSVTRILSLMKEAEERRLQLPMDAEDMEDERRYRQGIELGMSKDEAASLSLAESPEEWEEIVAEWEAKKKQA